MLPKSNTNMRQIKLIWDFYGEDAEATAKHHAIHLEDFAKMRSIPNYKAGTEVLNEVDHLAYLIVAEDKMIEVRDALKPKRGQWVES